MPKRKFFRQNCLINLSPLDADVLSESLLQQSTTGAALALAERGNQSPVLASEIKKIGTRDGKMHHWLSLRLHPGKLGQPLQNSNAIG